MGIEPTTFGLKDPPSLVLSFEINSLELGSFGDLGIIWVHLRGLVYVLCTSPMKVGLRLRNYFASVFSQNQPLSRAFLTAARSR